MNTDWAKSWINNIGVGGSALIDMFADNVQFEDVILAHKANGKAELIAFFTSLGGPDAGQHTFSFESYLGNANAGAVEWTWQIDHARDFLGVSAAGQQTRVKGVSTMTFKDGKIASQRDYWDAAGALRQLGALT